MDFPHYLQSIHESSKYLIDNNGIPILGMGDIGYRGYIKEAAIACFNAFNKADNKNQKLFFSRLIEEMKAFAMIEWDWPEEETEVRMARVLKGQSTLYEDLEGDE